MKFGKSLSNQIEETLPEWRDKFLSYKELKKRLKLVHGTAGSHKRLRSQRDGDAVAQHETDFITFIEAEMEKFNLFFVDKEEEYVIRLKELQDRLAKAQESNQRLIMVQKEIVDLHGEMVLLENYSALNYTEQLEQEFRDMLATARESNQQLIMVQKEIVDLHGEMVLLENYSALNYTGLVKIIKKYEKRTGAPIRIPLIQNVLQQPFYATDVIYKLVKQCESMVGHLFPTCDPSDNGPTVGNERGLMLGTKELEEIEQMESLYLKSTVSALRVLQEIRSKSSTRSAFSLPPLQEQSWKSAPILEQEAK